MLHDPAEANISLVAKSNSSCTNTAPNGLLGHFWKTCERCLVISGRLFDDLMKYFLVDLLKVFGRL